MTLRNEKLVALIGAVAAFGTYSCMYAFRKPFTVATYDSLVWLGINYKIWLIFAQTLGYTLSKFYGVKFISEMGMKFRSRSILVFILVSWGALLLFPLFPSPFNILMLFVNGIPLGMVWGVVFSYLEGRKYTEIMGAFLGVSFIFSSGLVKSIGAYLMLTLGVNEWWMPFLTGAVFIIPLLFFVWLLDQTPSPTQEDIALRNKRGPMTRKDRIQFFKMYGFGITMLVLGYVFLTLLRDLRDNFVANIWQEQGVQVEASLFTATEVPISVFVLIIIGLLVLVQNNLRAFMINHLLILVGFITMLVSTFLFSIEVISPVSWMVVVGLGLYMAYVPFNCVIFDRFLAVFKNKGNAGFLMYLADSFGYLGSIGFLFYKELGGFKQTSWTDFFCSALLLMSMVGILITVAASAYFYSKYKAVSEVKNDKLVLIT